MLITPFPIAKLLHYGVMGQVTSKKLDEERSHFQELKELEHHHT
jgi:hypothetical protein